MGRCPTLLREKRASNPQETGLSYLFLNPLLTPSPGRRRDLAAQAYLEKELCKFGLPLLIVSLSKGCLWLSPGLPAGHAMEVCGRPTAPVTGGRICLIPNSRRRCWEASWGWPLKPHPPKQLGLVMEFTFSFSAWPRISQPVLNLECGRMDHGNIYRSLGFQQMHSWYIACHT